jgi:pimeloyl-ACP methyl ester carboxylesterase
METRFVKSSDGASIAYDVSGSGPALILLHGGFVKGKQSWHEAGYVEQLSKDFTVIAVDLRGHGESDKPVTVEAYGVQILMDDVEAVADACGANDFSIWGFSYGATIALHLAASSRRVTKAVIAGSMFGQIFPEGYIESLVSEMELIAVAQEEGRLDELSLSPERQSFIADNSLRVVIASMGAMASWPPVEPRDLLCPALVLAGSKNFPVASALASRGEEIKAAGVELRIFDGLDHFQEFSETEILLPPVLSFLLSEMGYIP